MEAGGRSTSPQRQAPTQLPLATDQSLHLSIVLNACLPQADPSLFSFFCWGAPNTPSPGTCATPSHGFWEHPYPLHLEEAIRAVSDLQLPCPGTCSPGEAQVQRPHITFSHPVMQKNQAPAGPPSCFPRTHELCQGSPLPNQPRSYQTQSLPSAVPEFGYPSAEPELHSSAPPPHPLGTQDWISPWEAGTQQGDHRVATTGCV